MDIIEIISIHGAAIFFAGITTYTIIKCITSNDFINMYSDSEDQEKTEDVDKNN